MDLEKTLEWAVRNKRLDIIKIIASHTPIDDALELAGELKFYEAFEVLIEEGKLNDLDRIVINLAKSPQLELLKNFIIKHSIDNKSVINYALIHACKAGLYDNVDFLVIKCNADITCKNNAPIRKAAESGHKDILIFLLDVGADLHADDDYCVRWAAYHGHLDVVKYLVNLGANYKALNNWALRWARKQNRQAVVEYLQHLN